MLGRLQGGGGRGRGGGKDPRYLGAVNFVVGKVPRVLKAAGFVTDEELPHLLAPLI